MSTKTCSFFGLRPRQLPFGFDEADNRCAALRDRLRTETLKLMREDSEHFITGMDMGVGLLAAETVLELKDLCPGITLECAYPYEDQAARWPESVRDRYYDIASRCDRETLLQTRYTPDCFDRWIRYLADQADSVLAVWDGRPGWTKNAVRYARQQEKPVTVIDPQTLAVQALA